MTEERHTITVDINNQVDPDEMADAIDRVADRGETVWLATEDGTTRLCALVPVDVAEDDERRTAEALASLQSAATYIGRRRAGQPREPVS